MLDDTSSWLPGLLGVFSLYAVVLAYLLYDRLRRASTRLLELQDELDKSRQNRADERSGRTKAERELRQLLQRVDPSGLGQVDSASAASATGANSVAISGRAHLDPVAVVRSCFRDRRGTPRQGSVVQHSRGRIEMLPYTQPENTLEGLDEFSHLWVIFTFHQNTNATSRFRKQQRAQFRASHKPQQPRLLVKARVQPPRLNGKRVGLFSTRTPHRPNPIGLSLVRIERVDADEGVIHVSGLDLLDGTPVLDIKPYLGYSDSAVEDAHVPEWISQPAVFSTTWNDEAREQLFRVLPELHFFEDEADVVAAVDEVLQNDLRSMNQRRNGVSDGLSFRVDRLQINYAVDEDAGIATVVSVEISDE